MTSFQVTLKSKAFGRCLSIFPDRLAWEYPFSSLENLVGDESLLPDDEVPFQGNQQSRIHRKAPGASLRVGLSKYHLSTGCHTLRQMNESIGTSNVASPTELVFVSLSRSVSL